MVLGVFAGTRHTHTAPLTASSGSGCVHAPGAREGRTPPCKDWLLCLFQRHDFYLGRGTRCPSHGKGTSPLCGGCQRPSTRKLIIKPVYMAPRISSYLVACHLPRKQANGVASHDTYTQRNEKDVLYHFCHQLSSRHQRRRGRKARERHRSVGHCYSGS